MRNLVRFRMRPSLGCHFQELDERSDILFVGVHDNPFAMELIHNNTDVAVSAITKRRISAQAVMNYFSLFRICVTTVTGRGVSGDLDEILGR